MTRRLADGAANGRHPVAGKESIAIKLVEQLGAGTAEQHLDCFFFTAQDRTELSAVSSAKHSFREVSRMICDELLQLALRRIRRRDKPRRRFERFTVGFKQSTPGQVG